MKKPKLLELSRMKWQEKNTNQAETREDASLTASYNFYE